MRGQIVMAKCPILINANAGMHKKTATPDEMRELIGELELDAEIVETHSKEEMCELIKRFQAEGQPIIGVAGGDGTIHEAVQCVACSDTALLIIPQGTRNNFAHALKLPLELRDSLQVLRTGSVQAVDLGRAHATFFTEAAGVGLFASALEAYGNNNKNFWRGIYAILKIFFSMRAWRLRLTLDGEVVGERAVMCTIANGYRIGTGVSVAPQASVTDGLLDVVVLGDLNRWELIPYYRAMKHQKHWQLDKVRQYKAREIKVEAGFNIHVHVDDQVIGKTPVTIRVVPNSLKVLLPIGS